MTSAQYEVTRVTKEASSFYERGLNANEIAHAVRVDVPVEIPLAKIIEAARILGFEDPSVLQELTIGTADVRVVAKVRTKGHDIVDHDAGGLLARIVRIPIRYE